jgi:geranylgeranyl reductase family protein
MNSDKYFDIAIIGAGPAGCSAALTLQKSKLKVALFEKKEFPREKICGDGLDDRCINTLRAINPNYVDELLATQKCSAIENMRFYYKNKPCDINIKNVGYTCKRYDFDNFLFSLVKRDCQNVTVFQNTKICSVQNEICAVLLEDTNQVRYQAKMVLVCTGASSFLARKLTGKPFEKEKMGFAVRAYYKGVRDLQGKTIELHYKKEYFPGYLWIFPMADGIANVGVGWHLGQKHNERFQDVLTNWIKNDDMLRLRFADAEQVGLMQGGLIPYSTKHFDCYGDNYCICGDTANLIDPISGGGIGTAMLSGHFAVQIAEKAITAGDCSANMTKGYSEKLCQRVQSEIKKRYSLQQSIIKHRWLLGLILFMGRQALIMQRIKKWYYK